MSRTAVKPDVLWAEPQIPFLSQTVRIEHKDTLSLNEPDALCQKLENQNQGHVRLSLRGLDTHWLTWVVFSDLSFLVFDTNTGSWRDEVFGTRRWMPLANVEVNSRWTKLHIIHPRKDKTGSNLITGQPLLETRFRKALPILGLPEHGCLSFDSLRVDNVFPGQDPVPVCEAPDDINPLILFLSSQEIFENPPLGFLKPWVDSLKLSDAENALCDRVEGNIHTLLESLHLQVESVRFTRMTTSLNGPADNNVSLHEQDEHPLTREEHTKAKTALATLLSRFCAQEGVPERAHNVEPAKPLLERREITHHFAHRFENLRTVPILLIDAVHETQDKMGAGHDAIALRNPDSKVWENALALLDNHNDLLDDLKPILPKALVRRLEGERHPHDLASTRAD